MPRRPFPCAFAALVLHSSGRDLAMAELIGLALAGLLALGVAVDAARTASGHWPDAADAADAPKPAAEADSITPIPDRESGLGSELSREPQLSRQVGG